MIAEMRGCVPGYSALLARTHLNEAWKDIRNMRGWSFQLVNGGFGTPGLTNAGTVTVAFGSTSVLGDLQASEAWAAMSDPESFITQQQFRVGQGTIYNIIAYGGNGIIAFGSTLTPGTGQTPGTYIVSIQDNGGPGMGATCSITVTPAGTVLAAPAILTGGSGYTAPYIAFSEGGTPATFSFNQFGVLTLDRFYYDTTAGAGLGYSIYQCYYVAPVQDFQAWESVVDVNNAIYLDTSSRKAQRSYADQFDPQRQIFSNPGSLIPYGVDNRPGSSTPGWRVFELYPQPQAQFSYATWFTRLGPDLVNPSDTVSYPITEHVVKCFARVKAYEWFLMNRDKANPRGPQNDSAIQFAMGAAAKEGAAQLKDIRSMDRDAVDMWYSVMNRVQGYGYPVTFNPANGTVNANNIF
jgi:hypothetical protein